MNTNHIYEEMKMLSEIDYFLAQSKSRIFRIQFLLHEDS